MIWTSTATVRGFWFVRADDELYWMAVAIKDVGGKWHMLYRFSTQGDWERMNPKDELNDEVGDAIVGLIDNMATKMLRVFVTGARLMRSDDSEPKLHRVDFDSIPALEAYEILSSEPFFEDVIRGDDVA